MSPRPRWERRWAAHTRVCRSRSACPRRWRGLRGGAWRAGALRRRGGGAGSADARRWRGLRGCAAVARVARNRVGRRSSRTRRCTGPGHLPCFSVLAGSCCRCGCRGRAGELDRSARRGRERSCVVAGASASQQTAVSRAPQRRVGGEVVGVAAARLRARVGRTHAGVSLTLRVAASVARALRMRVAGAGSAWPVSVARAAPMRGGGAPRMRGGGAGSADARGPAKQPNPALHRTRPCALFLGAQRFLLSLRVSRPGR